MRGQAYDFTFNAGLFVGSRERGPYVTFPRNICERHLFSRSCPKLRTLVDSLTPRLNHDKGVHRSHESSFPISLSTEEMRTIELGGRHSGRSTVDLHSIEFQRINIHGMEMFYSGRFGGARRMA